MTRFWAAAIVLLAAGLWATPVADVADPRTRVLLLSNPPDQNERALLEALRIHAEKAGWDGTKLSIDFQWIPVDGVQSAAAIRHVLAASKPRVVVVTSIALAREVQVVDSFTPIVFNGAADPVRLCLVDNLLRPTRNATGHTAHVPSEVKMLEALTDAYPDVHEVVALVAGSELEFESCPGAAPPRSSGTTCQSGRRVPLPELEQVLPGHQMMAFARTRGLRLEFIEMCSEADASLIERYGARPNAGFLVPHHYLFEEMGKTLVEHINRTRRPAIYARSFFLAYGGVLAMSPILEAEPMRPAFDQVIRVLSGHRPADLPVETPRGFEVYVSLKNISDSSLRPSLLTLRRADHLVR